MPHIHNLDQLAIAVQEAERHHQRMRHIRAWTIRELAADGMSQAAIAGVFGITPAAVSLLVKDHLAVPAPPNEAILVHETDNPEV